MSETPVIVALDYANSNEALAFVARVQPLRCALKVGNELFTAAGPDLVRLLVSKGFRVFLDLKFHDIPNTVAQACRAATRLGVWMMNVHVSGGIAMLRAAREAVDEEAARMGKRSPLLIGVTVLTSLDAAALRGVGVDASPEEQALRLAALAADCRIDGVVSSAQEARALRRARGSEFVLVTPGIRPSGAEALDQSRIMTPEEASAAGANFLVIGRPITRAADPSAELDRINSSLGIHS